METQMAAVWARVQEFPAYAVSTDGQVMHIRIGRTVKGSPNQKGYLRVTFHKREGDKVRKIKRSVHRLVAQAFIANPLGLPEVNHRDLRKDHNAAGNLQWVDSLQNHAHAMEHGVTYGKRHDSQQTPETPG